MLINNNPNSQEPIVKIKNLNLYFGEKNLRKQILFNINLKIYPQEVVIMTGPSGAGKTTLLSLIGGLRSVQEGSLKFLGQELRGARSKQLVEIRRQIGYIFQGHNLLEFLTAKQNVLMPFEAYRQSSSPEARSRAEAMLTAVKLADKFNAYPRELSGGQKQRVAIARALVSYPKLILADEPTASLDSKTGREIIEVMQQLARKEGTAILLITHDHRILDIADRIIMIEDGILASGTP